MFLQSITLKNVLSFKNTTIELGPLNVLIGANASGKSNFIEVIGLLQAPTDLRSAILRGGDIRTWIWLGDPVASPIASVECTLKYKKNAPPVRYHLEFSESAQGFVILDEWLQDATRRQPNGYFSRTVGQVAVGGHSRRKQSQESTGPIPVHASVLERWKSPVGKGFRESAIRNCADVECADVEIIPKQEVYRRLNAAAKGTKKGEYSKVEDAEKLLQLIEPNRVKKLSRNCRRIFDTVTGALSV
jgi:energy-coupling factor transporter ATP-binding protein EcfA2